MPKMNLLILVAIADIGIPIKSKYLLHLNSFRRDIKAAPCGGNQHCSDCHEVIGHCLTGCEDGYFDLMCSSFCSRGCKKNLCTLNERGLQVCTAGCIPGYQGRKCTDPCDNPGVECTKCPHMCDSGYCQRGEACVSGCSGSYYGSNCKNCSGRCKSCNRITGTCDVCAPPYAGPNCEHTCDRCLEPCNNGCQHACEPGFYGKFCDEVCSRYCQPNPSSIVSDCLAPNNTNSCLGECNKVNGACTHGCVNGRYGFNCSFRCNSKCMHGKCDATGACTEGCLPGYYGEDCMPCPDNCVSLLCHSANGSCVSGCTNGSYGEFCDHTCQTCLNGMCHQQTGACIKGCEASFSGFRCEHNCAINCSLPDCLTTNLCEGGSTSYVFLGGILTAAVVFAVCILLAAVFYFRRRMDSRRTHQRNDRTWNTVSVGETETPSPDYESLHTYCEISNNDTSAVSEPQHNHKGEGADIVIPAFAANTKLRDQPTTGNHSGYALPVSHMAPDDLNDKPAQIVKYLSPVHRQNKSAAPQRPLSI